ncbi:MAG TPA: hypothetical protein VFS39_18045 [Nitrospira sp.]|nr:hypothetical protein [Nitrospira sp.]
MKLRATVVLIGCLILMTAACVTDKNPRDVAGPYQTWDDVIKRWIGGNTDDLYVELGPPNLHPHLHENGLIEMVWDFGIDRMPGQADAFNLLPLYGGNVNCQVHFFADQKGVIKDGNLVGCQ